MLLVKLRIYGFLISLGKEKTYLRGGPKHERACLRVKKDF